MESAESGTSFDGEHLYQLSQGKIQKIDRDSGEIVATVPAPEGGNSGMAWAEGRWQQRQGACRAAATVVPCSD